MSSDSALKLSQVSSKDNYQIRIIVVNFDGGDLVLSCLESLVADKYPNIATEIILVDNGSIDKSVSEIRKRWPEIEVIETLENLGFGAGVNLGIRSPGSFDYVALVNPDAYVSSGWLQPLVEEMEENSKVGAVSPKILFAGEKSLINLKVLDPVLIKGKDTRVLGVRLVNSRIFSSGSLTEVEPTLTLGMGWYGQEESLGKERFAVWSKEKASIVVDIRGLNEPRIYLQMKRKQPAFVILESGSQKIELTVGPRPVWVQFELENNCPAIIQNVGSGINRRGHGADRGFWEFDEGQHDEPGQVFAWCGGAVLLRSSYLEDVGLFDERMFLYYEDLDLSWRGQLRGWEYTYVPSSVVHHYHAQSTGEWSPLFRFCVDRNRILNLVKNAPFKMALIETIRVHLGALKVLVNDLFLRCLLLRLPRLGEIRHQIKYLADFWVHFPSVASERLRSKILRSRTKILKKGLSA